MADTKLSALAELATTPAVDDEVYIRDVSEEAADESKRITVANLMAAGTVLTVAETEVYNAAAPVAFTDLDLNAVVGANAALVMLKVVCSAGTIFHFRRNGDADDRSPTYDIGTAVGEAAEFGVVLVETDAAGIVEWYKDDDDTVTVDVIAYIK